MTSDHRLERPIAGAQALGQGSTLSDVERVVAAHAEVFGAVGDAASDIAAAVDLIVARLSDGGRLVVLGAGTSGWLAALDAAETVVTFGVRGRVESVVAGGHLLDPTAMSVGDDDVDEARRDGVLAALGRDDVVLAVSASGRTPFTIAGVEVARQRGARVVALVSAADAPLAAASDVAICVPVSGEVIGGSTRLTAGLAQKLVLNTISTIAMVRLGRAVDGHMVCVEPLNDKLRMRAVAAIAAATDSSIDAAAAALAAAGGAGDVATVSLLAGIGVAEATARLAAARGSITVAVAVT